MEFKRRFIREKLLVTGVVGIASAAQMAHAEGPMLEEIIVTAQKVEESLQKIPVSVTAMTAGDLEKKGISSPADLLTTRIPGVSFQPYASRTDLLNITMRGAANSDPSPGTVDAAVAIVEDDVYNARGTGLNFGLAEIERMEILRGPQGTLFGRNALGGAIRIITKQPTGEWGANLKVNAGNFGYHSEEAHLNTQEFGGLSFKVDLKKEDRDGFTKNAATPSAISRHRDFGELDNEGGKITVQYKPTDTLKFLYAFEDETLKQTVLYTQHGFPPAACAGGGPCVGASALVGAPNTNIGDYPGTSWIGMYNDYAVTKVKNHHLNIDYQATDNITLKSITAHSETDSAIIGNNLNGAYTLVSFGGAPLGSVPPLFGGPFNLPAVVTGTGLAAAGLTSSNQVYGLSGVIPFSDVNSKSTSQEFQVIGNTDTLKWVAGAYWFQEEVVDYRQTAFSIAYTGYDTVANRPINPVAVDPVGLSALGGNTDQSETLTQGKVKAYAGFGQATWTPAVVQQLHITGGLRYSHEHRTFHRSVDNGAPVDIDKPTFTLGRWDPTVSVAYDLSDTTNVYVRYASAYRAGGASVRAPWTGPFGNLAVFQEEVHKSVEAGIKSDLFDRRLRVNAAAFFTRMEGVNYSVQLDPVNPSITGTINLPGTQKVKGVELESAFVATEHLTLSGNFTWQHYDLDSAVQAYIDRTEPGAIYYLAAPFPKYSGGLAADYVLPLPVGQLLAHADWSKSSRSAGTPRVPAGNFNIPVWTDIVNARIGWQDIKVGSAALKVMAYGKNLANKHNPLFSATSGQWASADPRTYGLEVSADF